MRKMRSPKPPTFTEVHLHDGLCVECGEEMSSTHDRPNGWVCKSCDRVLFPVRKSEEK